MLKRKINPSTEGRDLSIRSCTKDLRLRRVFSLGSDSKGIESNDNGGADVGSCEAAGGKDPSMDVEIKDASKECEKVDKFCDFVKVFLSLGNMLINSCIYVHILW